MTPEDEVLETGRIENDPIAFGLELAKAGPDPEVILEATYGWYRAADYLAECGGQVHLARTPAPTGATGGSRTTNGTPPTWPTCSGWAAWPGRGSRRAGYANSGS